MRKYVSTLTGLVMTLALAFISYALAAQQKCANTSCSCGGSIIAGGCAINVCCKPNVANCQCSFFSNKCDCSPGAAGSATSGEAQIPTVNEQNAYAFASYLNSPDFTSAQAKTIAAKLPTLIAAAQSRDIALYDTTAGDLETLARSLPATEKSKANAWVSARGGTVFIE